MSVDSESDGGGSLRRGLAILRALASDSGAGMRLVDIAEATRLSPTTVHRVVRMLEAENIVTTLPDSKRYRLGIEFFQLAASAGNPTNIRRLARPSLLRLTAALQDTVFLLVRSGFDAVCLDFIPGPFPIRSIVGDVGGRVMLGLGQGATAILSFLPPEEQIEVIRHNLPRLRQFGNFDEPALKVEIARTRASGYSDLRTGLVPGMAGLAVPILDADGRAIAALTISTAEDRLSPERTVHVAEVMKREASLISAQLNPFDPALRWVGAALDTGNPLEPIALARSTFKAEPEPAGKPARVRQAAGRRRA